MILHSDRHDIQTHARSRAQKVLHINVDNTLEITNRNDGEVTGLGFDPILVSLGFGYRF